YDVQRTLKDNIEAYGIIRLQRLINHDPPSELDGMEIQETLRDAAGVAKACAITLGRYLGDFCVLLHDQLGVSAFRLTGGVLSGETGRIAKHAAEARVAMYGLALATRGAVHWLVNHGSTEPSGDEAAPQTTVGLDDSNAVERGALGAAWFAAASLVNTQK